LHRTTINYIVGRLGTGKIAFEEAPERERGDT
jgi:hypothetical protein